MQLRDGGKEHQAGDFNCAACDQKGIDGRPLAFVRRRFPHIDTSGNPPCGGLVHSEVFPDDMGGAEMIYKCDKCGGLH
jgi:hypothetical protein